MRKALCAEMLDNWMKKYFFNHIICFIQSIIAIMIEETTQITNNLYMVNIRDPYSDLFFVYL